jgi:hypothetical protein
MANQDREYNGWTNYETWVVNLHMSNDQSSQDYWDEAAAEALETANAKPGMFTTRERAAFAFTDRLKEEHEQGTENFYCEAPRMQQSVYADLINAALSEVNWGEIAEHYLNAKR